MIFYYILIQKCCFSLYCIINNGIQLNEQDSNKNEPIIVIAIDKYSNELHKLPPNTFLIRHSPLPL